MNQHDDDQILSADTVLHTLMVGGVAVSCAVLMALQAAQSVVA